MSLFAAGASFLPPCIPLPGIPFADFITGLDVKMGPEEGSDFIVGGTGTEGCGALIEEEQKYILQTENGLEKGRESRENRVKEVDFRGMMNSEG